MKRTRRVLSFTLAILMTAAVSAGCGKHRAVQTGKTAKSVTFPLSAPVTLKIWKPAISVLIGQYPDQSQLPIYQELTKKTGINFKILCPAVGEEKDQFNLMVSSGDLPDILDENSVNNYYPGGLVKAYTDGIITKLNDLQSKYAPDLLKIYSTYKGVDAYAKDENGNYLGVPFIRGAQITTTTGGMIMRKDWLDIQPARSRYPFGFDTQRKLINFIRAGDYPNALSTVNTVFDVQHLQDGVSVEMTQYTLYGLVNAMAQAMEGMADDGGMDVMEALKPLARTSPTRTVPDIKDEIQRVLQELCQCRNTDKKKCRNTDLQERVTQYVDRHYADSNMGVSGVAEYFHMNSLYLSRIFREQTGKSLPDYITECRIQKAKELIRQGHNVQNVSNEVGYANANSFIRIFKKVEGITPGKYSEEYSMPV